MITREELEKNILERAEKDGRVNVHDAFDFEVTGQYFRKTLNDLVTQGRLHVVGDVFLPRSNERVSTFGGKVSPTRDVVIDKVLEEGAITLQDVRRLGLSDQYLGQYTNLGHLERIGRGVYALGPKAIEEYGLDVDRELLAQSNFERRTEDYYQSRSRRGARPIAGRRDGIIDFILENGVLTVDDMHSLRGTDERVRGFRPSIQNYTNNGYLQRIGRGLFVLGPKALEVYGLGIDPELLDESIRLRIEDLNKEEPKKPESVDFVIDYVLENGTITSAAWYENDNLGGNEQLSFSQNLSRFFRQGFLERLAPGVYSLGAAALERYEMGDMRELVRETNEILKGELAAEIERQKREKPVKKHPPQRHRSQSPVTRKPSVVEPKAPRGPWPKREKPVQQKVREATNTDFVIDYVLRHGTITQEEFKELDFPSSLAYFAREGFLERVGRGVYALGLKALERYEMGDVADLVHEANETERVDRLPSEEYTDDDDVGIAYGMDEDGHVTADASYERGLLTPTRKRTPAAVRKRRKNVGWGSKMSHGWADSSVHAEKREKPKSYSDLDVRVLEFAASHGINAQNLHALGVPDAETHIKGMVKRKLLRVQDNRVVAAVLPEWIEFTDMLDLYRALVGMTKKLDYNSPDTRVLAEYVRYMLSSPDGILRSDIGNVEALDAIIGRYQENGSVSESFYDFFDALGYIPPNDRSYLSTFLLRGQNEVYFSVFEEIVRDIVDNEPTPKDGLQLVVGKVGTEVGKIRRRMPTSSGIKLY